MRGRRLMARLPWALVLAAAVAAYAEPVTVYRCRLDGAAETVSAPVARYGPADLEGLRAWDQFAVATVARAVRGEVRLADALPMFSALAARGPYAGAFGASDGEAPPEAWDRGLRLLDAAARLAAGPPLGLVRELLADAAVLEALRSDPSSEAPGAARALVASRLGNLSEGLPGLLPALRPGGTPLAEAEALGRALEALDRGETGPDLERWLARTLLWDLRLYLLAKGDTAQAASAAAGLTDEALTADWRATAAAAHLRFYLLGPREAAGNAERWATLEAERFIGERPDWAWVGQAAALAWELREGTTLAVRGPGEVPLAQGESAPVACEVGPAGGSFAAPALVWPRSASKVYEGLRCVRDTAATLVPRPVDGVARPAGLRYELVFTRPGVTKLTFQYSLYGLGLPAVSHPVTASSTAAGAWRATAIPPGAVDGYGVTRRDGREVLRRVDELGGGTRAVESEIACDRITGPAGELPEDLEPGADELVRQVVLRKLAAAGSELAGPAEGGALDVVWVGKRARDAAGAPCYLLARGARWVCLRGETGGVPRWERLVSEDAGAWREAAGNTGRLVAQVAQAAQAAAASLTAGPAGTGAGVAPEAWLAAARELLAEDERLAAALNEAIAQVKQGSLSGEDAARKVGQELVVAWTALEGRVAQQVPPAELARASRDLATHLSIATGLARLAEDALWSADATGLERVRQMLEAQATLRRGMTATPPAP